MDEHRRLAGSDFAAKYKCTKSVYFESFFDIREAIAREKQLKGWRRGKKIWLIERENPQWNDLCEKWFGEY